MVSPKMKIRSMYLYEKKLKKSKLKRFAIEE